MKKNYPITAVATDVPARRIPSVYPEPFASMMNGRTKHALGDLFGINNFGVNLTRLSPGSQSALLHRHTQQEEFIFVLEGDPILITEINETQLHPGMCAGFTPGGVAHQLVNRTSSDVCYLEIGNRIKGDKVSYPADDLVALFNSSGQWAFTHKNGDPYS